MADDTPTEPKKGDVTPPATGEAEQEQPKPKAEIPAEVRAALHKANKEAETLRLKLKEFEDRDKTEADKLAERLANAEARALQADRLEIALEKGLSRSQAKRLVGATREELEADADELLEDLGPRVDPAADKSIPPPGGKPREQLKPGSGDPDAPVEETDIKKLGARMFER